MGILRIKNLRLPAKHGVYDFEKNEIGIFGIDIHMHLDLNNAMKSDNLDETVDYFEVVELVKRIFSEKDYNLIECVAGRIGNEIIKKFYIEKVVVKIRKPHAPINANLDTVEVEIEKSR